MNENQNPETDENVLEDCLFHLTVKDGVTSLKVEGTLGGIAEAFANAALQSPQLDEVLKMVTYMLFENHIETKSKSNDNKNKASDEAAEWFSQIGHA